MGGRPALYNICIYIIVISVLSPGVSRADIVHDDFNDSSTSNDWGGSTGTFTGSGGTISINRISSDASEGARSLEMQFDVTASSAYSGYYSRLNDTNLFTDTANNRAVSFFVKGLAGHEVFKIEVGESDALSQKTLVRDFINGGVTTAWRQVYIPMMAYDQLNFNDSRWTGNLAFVFEDGLGSPKSGTIRIDSIQIVKTPDTYLVDTYDDGDTQKSSFGGTNTFYENQTEMNAQRDTSTFVGDTGASLRIAYTCTGTSSGNYTVYEQTVNNGLGKGQDVRFATSLHFWIRADTGLRGPLANVWLIDMGNGSNQKDIESFVPAIPIDTWVPVNIPIRVFSGVDTPSLKMIKWAWEYEDKSGTMWLDAVEFSKGYDLSVPAAPALSKPAADTVMQETTPAFSWNSVSDGQGVSYFIQVTAYEDTDFSDPILREVTSATSLTFAQALANGGRYRWRVAAFDGHGNWSIFSDSRAFKIQSATHDDFNDSATTNKWGGAAGIFTGGAGAITINRTSADAAEGARSLEIAYTATGASGDYSGYYSELNNMNVTDTPRNRALSFTIKGLAGNEVFKVELGESTVKTQQVAVRDFLNGGVSTAWRDIHIPLSAFDQLNFTNPWWNRNLAFVFEYDLGTPRSGTVRIDNIRLTSEPETYLVDSYDDADTSKSSFGGTMVYYENNADLNAQRDTSTYVGDTGASLRIFYNVTGAGSGNYVVIEQTVNNGVNKGQDIRHMSSLHFWVKADSGTRGPPANVWMHDMGNASSQKDLEAYIPALPTDTWVPVNIPLRAFSGVDSASLKMIKWAWEYEDKSGTMWIDAVEFSKGYDVTAPNTPVLSGVYPDSTPTFSWTGGNDAQGESYYIQVAAFSDTKFENVILSSVTGAASITFTQTLSAGSRYHWRVAAFDRHGNWTGFSDTKSFVVFEDTGRSTVFVSDRGDSSNVGSADTRGAFGGIFEAISYLDPANGADTVVIFNRIGSDSYRLTAAVVPDSGMTMLSFREWNRRVNGQNTDTGGGTDTYARLASSADTALLFIPNIDNVTIAGLILDGESTAGSSKAGVLLSNSRSDSISLVHIYRANTGIRLAASLNNAIAACILTGNDSASVSLQTGASNNTVGGNSVRGGGFGIHVSGDQNVIVDNTVYGAARAGLYLDSGTANRVQGNRIQNGGSYGVMLSNSAQGNYAALNEIDSTAGAAIYIGSSGTNHTDTFEANNITNCTTAVINEEAATFDLRYNWWGSRDEDAVTDSAVNTGGGGLLVLPLSLWVIDTSAGADTVSPDSTKISVDSTVTTTGITITWDTVSVDRDSTALGGLAGYHVYRRTSAGTNWFESLIDTVLAGGGTDTRYTDSSASVNNTYYYRVTAFDSHYTGGRLFLNESWFSDTRIISTPETTVSLAIVITSPAPGDTVGLTKGITYYLPKNPSNYDTVVLAQFSPDSGANWYTILKRSGDTQNLLADADGETYTLTWNVYSSLFDTSIAGRVQIRMAATSGSDTVWDTVTDFNVNTVIDSGGMTVFVSNGGDSSYPYAADTDGGLPDIGVAFGLLTPANGADTVVIFNRIGSDSYRLTAAVVPDSGMTILGFREWNRRVNGQNTDTGGGIDTYATLASSADTAIVFIPNIDNVTIAGLILDGESAAGSARAGILLSNSRSDSISLVHIYRANTGIRLAASLNNAIAANILAGNDSAGASIQAGSSNNTVRGNSVWSGGLGIHVGGDQNIIVDNTVYGTARAGLYLDSGAANRVQGNRVQNGGSYGMMLSNSAQGNYAALNEIDSTAGAAIYIGSSGTNHTDTFEANNITNCTTAVINEEAATFDLRYNWWGSRDEDAVTDSAVNTGGGGLLVLPLSLWVIDTSAGADTVSPDSTKISVDSTVTTTGITITWDTVSVDRDSTALGGLTGYHVYRRTGAGTNWYESLIDTVLAGGGTDTKYADTGLNPSATYYYRVTAFDSHYTGGRLFLNESWFSDTRAVTTSTPSTSDTNVHDHYNDSVTTNNFGGTVGSFTGGSGVSRINRITTDALEGARSMQIDYTVASSGDFAGLYSELNNWNPADTGFGRFWSFWVKGLAGQEIFYLEFGESTAKTQQLTVADFVNGGIDTVWQEVNIPLMALDDLNITNPKWNRNFALVFSNALGPPTNGSVRVDSVSVKKYIDTFFIDTFDDPDTFENSWGGTNTFYANGGGALKAKRDTGTFVGDTGASLVLPYGVPNPSGGDYAVAEFNIQNGAGWWADLSQMTSLRFHIKGDSASTDKQLNIWLIDNSSADAIVDLEKFIPDLPTTSWVPVNIPLSQFYDGAPPDTKYTKLIKFAWESDAMSGTTWIDAIEVSRGYNLSPPDTPANQQPAAAADTGTETPVFRWSASTDAQGVSYFVQVASIFDTDFTDPILSGVMAGNETTFSKGLKSSNTYQWRVAAFDGHGNWTGFSDSTRFRVVSGNFPVIKLTHPDSNAVQGTATLFVGGVLSDTEDTPTRVDFLVNGAYVSDTAAVDSSGAFGDTLTFAAAGTYTVTAICTDQAGNTASATLTLTIDLGAPKVEFTARAAGETQTTVTITGTVSDSKQVTELRVTHNSDTVTLVSLSADSKAFSFSVSVTLVSGKNQFVAKATDTAGLVGYDTLNILRTTAFKTAAGGTTVALPEGSQYDTWVGVIAFSDTASTPVEIPMYDPNKGSYADKLSMTIKPADSGVILMVRRPPDTMDLKLGTVDLKRSDFKHTIFEFNLFDSAGENNIGGSSGKFSTLSLSLKPAATTIAGVAVTDLKLYTLNEQAGRWEEISGSGYDASTGEIKGTLSHLSFYAFFPDTTKLVAAELSGVMIFPNPFVPNDGVDENGRWAVAGDFTTGIVIDNLTDDVLIRIFTITGKIVLEQRVQNAGRTQWNVTNKVGDKLASGIYLIHVKDMKGRGEAVRKVAVVK